MDSWLTFFSVPSVWTPNAVILLILLAGAFVAGWIDSIAGGGGLITVPLLLGVGMPPHMALGTNKFQSSFGSVTASIRYTRRGAVNLKVCFWGMVWTLVGAALGAWGVQRIRADFLGRIIPALLLLMFLYLLFQPRLGFEARRPRLKPVAFYPIAGLILGFYDGFFGPGTGNFWVLAHLTLLGMTMVPATGHTKIMNATSNVVSLLLFARGGKIFWAVGLLMAIGQFAGASLGSGQVLKRGAAFVRPVFLLVVLAMIVSLVIRNWF